MMKSMTRMRRRQDIFIGVNNEVNPDEIWVRAWVTSMGLFDAEYLWHAPYWQDHEMLATQSLTVWLTEKSQN